MGTRILLIDDDPIVCDSLAELLRGDGHDTTTAYNAEEALTTLEDAAQEGSPFALAICDVSMPGMNGMELLRRMGKDHPSTVVIMLTGYGTIESAVEALRLGASDYLTKPVVDAELRVSIERAIRQQVLIAENHTLKEALEGKYGMDSIVGADTRMRRIYELIEAVAPSRTTVLMSGESGTGKSMIARAIHQHSPRRDHPFVEISCGSIPETLLESELFGHVKGAFTGAHVDKTGRFQAADQGTIFLDEINSASPGMQLKLLRVLQERRFEPVGSTETIEVDVRVVLASNQDLEALVSQGQFRQDLYYRINVVTIELPPLRDRVGDIPLLAERFLGIHAAEMGKQLTGLSPEAIDALRRYDYPGNVRELQNIMERAAVLARRPTIGLDDLPEHVIDPRDRQVTSIDDDWSPMALIEALKDPERQIILKALRANDWNRQATADQLEINRTTLYKKMRQLGIDAEFERMAS